MKDFATFAALHVPGNPVVLFNVWDAGSAKVVVEAGGKAIATGSHPVADALAMGDGETVPLDLVFANARRIVAAVDVPVTIDFEGAYSADPQEGAANAARLKETGAVGCNFEDQIVGGEGLHPLEVQVKRIEAIRRAVGDDFFINARTDLRLKDQAAPLDEVIARGKAFADAGASGFFVPRLADRARGRARGRRGAAAAQPHRLSRRPAQSRMGRGRVRADQPWAVPAPRTDGDVQADGGRGDRLTAFRRTGFARSPWLC